MERTIRSLTRHYPRRDDVVIQVLAVLDRFQGVLNPEQSDFTYDDGRVELLLSLTGVLPIPIQANTYHCPIVFWLPLDFPSAPPIVFILPSETLAVRKGKNVDAGGRVSVQYLEQWSRKHEGCSLLKLIEELIPIFSARYPVTTIQPKPPARPSPPSSSEPSSSTSAGISQDTRQAAPPRPPLPAGSSSASPGTLGVGSVSQPPPRPPLPLQSNLEARLTSANSGGYSRPTSYGELRTPAGPPRPPPPPSGISLNHSATLPPGPPPGYHPPPSSNPMPPYTAPQRSATTDSFSAREPPTFPPGFPGDPRSTFPRQPPIPQFPERIPLGAPIASQAQSSDPARRYSTMPPAGPQPPQPPPQPPALPLPGTFSSPVEPLRTRPDSISSHTQSFTPARPESPTASTARAYSPAPSTVADLRSPHLASPTQAARGDSRYESHYDRDPRDSQTDPRRFPVRQSREFAQGVRPYSPTSSIPFHTPISTPPRDPRPRPLSFDSNSRSYSPAPSSVATSVLPELSSNARAAPGGQHPQQRGPRPKVTSAASASEYDPEYGSYAPPSRGGQPTPRYDPYQSATNDPRYPQPPRPPSAAFEPTVEPRTDHAHLSRGPSDQSRPFDRAQSSQDSGGPRLPPPVGFTRQGEILPQTAEMPQQGMRNSARRHAAPAPSISSSVNILDAADEDLASPSSVVPTSPSSASTTKQDAPAHVAPPPVPPNPAVLALRTRLHSKLSSALSTLHAETTKNHLEPLSLMHSDLLKAVPAIEDEMARLRAVRDVCLSVRDRYETVVNEGEKRMAEYERKGDGVDVDEIVCGSTVVYTQLLDLVAEDAALEDTIYALGRGLNSGTANIDLDQFLKRVRALAREQFIKRATINKILLGLAIRRERNQQQHRERNGDAARTTASRNGSGQAGRGTPTTT